jgi:hypothetical protein
MISRKLFCIAALSSITLATSCPSFAQSNADSNVGTLSGQFNLRFESVDQSNALDDAEALTLSSKLAYRTGTASGFSALLEIENVQIISGIDNYTVGPSNFNRGRYSVIADPETTELDQSYVQYDSDRFTAKIGRQVITYDNHRFVGHVGWRQDRQTFDAVSFSFKPTEKLDINYNYLDKRRRIFAEDADIDSDDHLIHIDYKTSLGTFTGYGYFLETENNTRNSLNTVGLRFSGSETAGDTDISYLVEYASQESETVLADYDADYLLLEGGVTLDIFTVKLGYEILGSDSGLYGFSTPLSTLHAHNGWADLFLGTPAQGLTDTYLNFSGKVGGGSWSVIYHDFEAEDSTSLVDDIGRELDLQYLYPVSDKLSLGVKYASYSDGDTAANKPDTDKFWLWLSSSF